MTIKEYVTEFLPDRFNKHEPWKKIVEMIFDAEKNGEELFSNTWFKTPRDRAALAIPYQIGNIKERERVLNVLELIILKHREEKHEEDWSNRIIELQENTVMTTEEAKMITSPLSFWSG